MLIAHAGEVHAHFWRYQAHPEVWVLLAAVIVFGIYAVRVIGPRAVPPGAPIATARQRLAFWGGVVSLWVASDWPMHDIAEEYLYSVHMVQHLLITFIVAPLFLLATPEWLARLVVSPNGTPGVWVRRLAHPVVAGVLFNAMVALSHAPAVVNNSVENGPLHYTVHFAVFSTALLMWTPVCGPLPELRISRPAQMLYLFLMSVLPTIPGAWLTFAEGSVYDAYDHPERLWGVTVRSDQQAAGLVMKIAGGFYLWTIIAVKFFRWAAENGAAPPVRRPVTVGDDSLTYADVAEEFERLGPAPVERVPGDS